MKPKTNLVIHRILALVILASLTLTATAQKKTDFSGTWNLDKSQSNQHPEFSWAPVQLNISHDGNSIAIERVSNFQGQEYRQTSKYSLDGEESVNEGFQGEDIISVANWSEGGKGFSIETEFETQDGGTMTIISTYEMKDKQVHIEFVVKGGPMGESTENWVYTKE